MIDKIKLRQGEPAKQVLNFCIYSLVIIYKRQVETSHTPD